MNKEKKIPMSNLSMPKSICLLVMLCMMILLLIASIFNLSHKYQLPIEYEELTILLSILGGLVGTGISGAIILYITMAQLAHQKNFFLEQKALESGRFFFQFYLTEIGKFEETHQKWIQNSDHFMKFSSSLSMPEFKMQLREIRDPLVLLERYHSIFISKDYDELWTDFRMKFNLLHKWLIEKNAAILQNGEIPNLAEEYYNLFYKTINQVLSKITEKLMIERKNLVLKISKRPQEN